MNNEFVESEILTLFISRGFIFAIDNQFERIKAEEQSILRLFKQYDYLDRYNLAIRHVFLWFLKKGFDIKHNSVHPCFKLFLQIKLGLHFDDAKSVIDTRNRLKYSGIKPAKDKFILLIIFIIYIQIKP